VANHNTMIHPGRQWARLSNATCTRSIYPRTISIAAFFMSAVSVALQASRRAAQWRAERLYKEKAPHLGAGL
jgi:predicted lysophospholipase L1 biosynthesis ABC-type transport system permease subunit